MILPRRTFRRQLAAAIVAVFILATTGLVHAHADDGDPGGDTPPAAVPMPMRLVIPSIHINAPIEDIGLDDDGVMQSPSGPDSVGWFAPGFRPGDPGNAVIDGHVDWVDRGAVFWFVRNLAPGDEIDVVYDDGSENAFTVDGVQTYPDGELPLDNIFAYDAVPHLNLITCDGVFNRSTHNYDHRTVIYTTLASAESQ